MACDTADLVLTGGKVVTLDPSSRVADGVAIKGERILAVGNDREIGALVAGARRIDLGGRTVVPGLIDGHAHMDREGLKDRLPSLAGARSIDDILQIISGLARDAAPGAWIVTMPVGEPPQYRNVPECLVERRWPNRHDLDRAAPDNPVYIRPIWGYWRRSFPVVSIANSAALAAAGITRDTVPPVATVEIAKDADGEPTGIFLEHSFMPIVEHTLMSVIPRFDHEDRVEGLRRSMRAYNAYGTTSVFEGHGVNSEVFAAYRALGDRGPLPVRAHLVFSPSWKRANIADIKDLLGDWAGWLAGRGLGDAFLRVGGLFAEPVRSGENALRTQTAPYCGWAGFNYDCELPPDLMVEMMIEAARAGIRISANRIDSLAFYERVDRVAPIAGQRWVIGHVGVIDAEQIRRIADLGLVLTTYTHRYIHDEGESLATRLGPAKAATVAPLRSLLDAGIHVALATDNVPPTLFEPIWHAVARKPRGSQAILSPDQALTPEEALACASREGAWLTFEETEKGTIEPGKLADLAVLSADPCSVDVDDLRTIVSDLTITGGRIVHDRATDGLPRPGGSGETWRP